MNPFETPKPESIFSFGIEEQGKRYLLQTARWTKFLAIMGFIVIGIMLIAGIIIAVAGGASHSYTHYENGADYAAEVLGTILGFLLIIGLYFYPTMMLLRFSNATRRAIAENNQALLTASQRYQRNLFMYTGILLIIIIVIYIIVFALIFGVYGLGMLR